MKYNQPNLFPDAAEGGTITTEASTDQATAEQTAIDSQFSQAPDQANAQLLPPVDWSKEKDLSLDDFRGKQPAAPTVSAKPEGDKTNEEIKDQVQQGEKVQQTDDLPEGERVVEEKVVPTTQQQPIAEDPVFKRFPEAKVFLKKMSKEAAEFTIARLNEVVKKESELDETSKALAAAQAGKPQIPANYYENPNAVVLLPEFQQATYSLNLANKIATLWNSQYEQILSGEEWHDVEEVFDKAGNLTDVRLGTAALKADGSSQAAVGRYVRQAERQVELLSEHQSKIVREFKDTVTTKLASFKKAENEMFPPEKYETKGKPEFELTQNVKAGLRNMGHTESNPLFNVVAKLGATVLQLREFVAHQTKTTAKQTNIGQKAIAAGPTGKITGQAGAPNGAEPEDVMGEFNKLLIHKR